MADPSFALQAAIIAALAADAGVTALVPVARIYDEPPQNQTFPYIYLGEAQVLPEKYDQVDGSEPHLTIHAYSRRPGFGEVKRVTAAIVAAIDDQPPDVTGFAVIEFLLEQINYLHDPDGVTRHAAIVFRAVIDAQ